MRRLGARCVGCWLRCLSAGGRKPRAVQKEQPFQTRFDMSKDLEAFVAAQDHFELVSIADKAKVRRTCTVYVERWLRFSLRPLLPLAQVRCTLTGHEMLPELEICRLYLGGKAYKRALRRRGAPPAAARAQPPRSCADQRTRAARRAGGL